MKQYKLVDNILGWVTFLIAAFVYCSTIEPTASFWDCPEFITTGYKLEVGHPPGAPFFMLTANLFSHFASDPTQVAKMVNTMSALLSATCILFLFWTITHLARRLVIDKWSDLTTAKLIAIEGSGLVGALIYTFSDTFWFSAVEGEVYAYSSAFTAIVFWLILKWEEHADEPHSDRWLVLITYMTGLSIGVHLLNLLCIPAIVLVFYYRKFPNANLKGSIVALLLSFVIVAAVLYGVIPGIVTVGGWFELFFVNGLHLPFNTGLIIYIVLLLGAFVWAIYETYNDRSQKLQNIATLIAVALIGIPFYGWGWGAFITGVVVLAVLAWLLRMKRNGRPLVSARIKNTALLCMVMLVIGYSSYALIVIRSTANPPMDQNSPEDIFTLGSYLSRDQYGNRPLFYGPAYTSQVAPDETGTRAKMKTGAPVYERKEKKDPNEPDSYYLVRTKDDYVYAQNMLFPRMYDPAHAQQYESWMGGVKGHQVPYGDGFVKMPTQWENLKFFFSYQCNFMYWRYFMWNFSGRQNDLQGNGEPEHGNWITGIPFIDNAMYGDQSLMPDELKQNKGHNTYFMLPLLLGIIGLLWQWNRGKRGIQQFWIVTFLFFMTGLAIVLYLNQTPSQPRERDYAYAGSFYAFSIWCGLGVAALIDWLRRAKLSGPVVAAVVTLLCLFVPYRMGSQNWDDHDRSGRFTCRDFGQNYLMSLQQKGNPVIFTNGDNDTFPLWYNQEVEGVRTDARVCNLSYLQTDWYIDQMKRPAYDSPSLPITWPRIDFVSGTNEYVPVMPDAKQQILDFCRTNPEAARKAFGDEKNPFELKNVMEHWVLNTYNSSMHVIPTDTLYLTVDKEAVRRSGMKLVSDTIPDRMVISLAGKNALYKGDLMMLEMLAHANWIRPLYVASTVGESNYLNLGSNFITEGLANRITPFKTTSDEMESRHQFYMDTEKTYDNVMNRFKFGGLSRKGFYVDETILRMCYTHRTLMARLALNLIAEGKKDKALKVLQKSEKEIPAYNVPMNFYSGAMDMARAYLALGNFKRGNQILEGLWNNSKQYVDFYMQFDGSKFMMLQSDIMENLQMMQFELATGKDSKAKFAANGEKVLENYLRTFQMKGGQLPQQ